MYTSEILRKAILASSCFRPLFWALFSRFHGTNGGEMRSEENGSLRESNELFQFSLVKSISRRQLARRGAEN
jgi:hypothetical protein